jgi:hypothetical protein
LKSKKIHVHDTHREQDDITKIIINSDAKGDTVDAMRISMIHKYR